MTDELRAESERARAALTSALSELEAKLNIPKRVRQRIARTREENPVAVVAGAAGLVVVVAAAVWFAARPGRR